ncbi:MAG: hypothetical protein KJN64_09775, partial [Ignavibacteria bacterium]|nr:hypothetical protein [Ignavibacteria bacterium]
MRTIKKFTMFTLLFSTSIFANNLSVGNVQLLGQDATNNFTFVQFDVSWENSWRTSTTDPYNYDAIWVFVKYRVEGEAEWKHATLNTSGYTPPTGSAIDVPSDGKGAFIYRDGNGTGTFSLSAVQLRWNYGVDGITDDNANVTVKVFAIEMVYIPTGSFHVGDGTSTDIAGHLHRADSTSVPFEITSEFSTYTLGGTSSSNIGNNNNEGLNIDYPDDFDNSPTTKLLPLLYPKGYDAFYMMKYEITQGQYVDFLNCLTRNQQDYRTETLLSIIPVTNRYVMTHENGSITMSARNSIRCDADILSSGPVMFYCDYNGDETPGDGKDLACN